MSERTAEGVTLKTYTLELIGPVLHHVETLDNPWGRWLRETEENLTDLLPPGYSVRIKEWDE